MGSAGQAGAGGRKERPNLGPRPPRRLGAGGEGEVGPGSRLPGFSRGPWPLRTPLRGRQPPRPPFRAASCPPGLPAFVSGSPVWPGPTINSPLASTPTPIKLYLKCHLNYEIVAENCA